MSLFDTVAAGVKSTGSKLVDGLFGSGVIGDTVKQNAIGLIRQNLPAGMGPMVNVGVKSLGSLANGDIPGAIEGVIDSGVLSQYYPHLNSASANALYFATPSPLVGGITPIQARAIYENSAAESYAKKNLFLIEIAGFGKSGASDVAENKFNLFAVECSYAPYTVTGDHQKIGSGTCDIAISGEPTELRLTTYDDQHGTLKKWFGYRSAMVAHMDGTVGLPIEYLLKIRVVHSFITEETAINAFFDGQSGYFRPASMELSLSRQDDGLEELQMTFTQFDTFIKAT